MDSSVPYARLPRGLMKSLQHLPDRPAAVILRHAHRGPLLPGWESENTVITDEGQEAARALGARFAGRSPGRILVSPSLRCGQTARALTLGAGWDGAAESVADYRLHGAGALIHDPEVAFAEFRRIGIDGVIQRLAVEKGTIPGFLTAHGAAERVLGAALECVDIEGPATRLDVLVSHDVVIAVVLAAVIGASFTGEPDLPAFLEGVLVFRGEDGGVHLAWEGAKHELSWPPRPA